MTELITTRTSKSTVTYFGDLDQIRLSPNEPFMLMVENDQFDPFAKAGDWLEMDPTRLPSAGDIVLARGNTTGGWYLGRFLENGAGGFEIKASNDCICDDKGGAIIAVYRSVVTAGR